MGEKRKLLAEIDRTIRKVDEGVEEFDEIWEKVQAAPNQSQKEKCEAELKKSIKKLQRLRDQLKSWQSSNEIKDKDRLTSKRKLVETCMERFKVIERETKTKAYSKEGLTAVQKLDPIQKEKDEIMSWLQDSIDKIQQQIDMLDTEVENLFATTRKKKLSSDAQEKHDELKDNITQHKFHVGKLETMMRLFDNDKLSPESIRDVMALVDYYIENNADADFIADDDIYDELSLDDLAQTVAIIKGNASSPKPDDDTSGTPTSLLTNATESSTITPPSPTAQPLTNHSAISPSAPSTTLSNHSREERRSGAHDRTPKATPVKSQQSAPSVIAPPPPPQTSQPYSSITANSISHYGTADSKQALVFPSASDQVLTSPSVDTSSNNALSQQQIHTNQLPSHTPLSRLTPPSARPSVPSLKQNGTDLPVSASLSHSTLDIASVAALMSTAVTSVTATSSPSLSGISSLAPSQSLTSAASTTSAAATTSTVALSTQPLLSTAPLDDHLLALQQQQHQRDVLHNGPTPLPPPGPSLPLSSTTPAEEPRLTVSTGSTGLSSTTSSISHQLALTHPTSTVAPSSASTSTSLSLTTAAITEKLHSPSSSSTTDRTPPLLSADASHALVAGLTATVDSFSSSAISGLSQSESILAKQQVGPLRSLASQAVTHSSIGALSTAPAPSAFSATAGYMSGASALLSGVATSSGAPGSSIAGSGVIDSTTQQLLSSVQSIPSAAVSAAVSAAASSSSISSLYSSLRHSFHQPQQLPQHSTQSLRLRRPYAMAPLGPIPLQMEHKQQLDMLTAAGAHMPLACDSERTRSMLQRTPWHIPSQYPLVPPLPGNLEDFFIHLSPECLFFVFYYMEGTKAQYLAAKALKKLSWRFHTKYMMWFQRRNQPTSMKDDHEIGTYIYWDYEKWQQHCKEDFQFEYRFLEDRDL